MSSALPHDVPANRHGFAITPRTLVPIGVVGLAFGLGFMLATRDWSQKADVTAKLVEARSEITALQAEVQLARVEIMQKLDKIGESVIADHASMMTKDDFDAVWRLARALNPQVTWPERK